MKSETRKKEASYMYKTEVKDRLRLIWTEVSGKEPEGDSTLKSLGASSLSLVLVKQKVYESFGVDIKLVELYRERTFDLQLELIHQKLS